MEKNDNMTALSRQGRDTRAGVGGTAHQKRSLKVSYTGCLGQAIYYTPRSSAITGYSALSATCCTVKLVSTQLLAKDRVHSTSARLCDQEIELSLLLGKQEEDTDFARGYLVNTRTARSIIARVLAQAAIAIAHLHPSHWKNNESFS